MATDLFTLLEGAALTKFIGPAAEHYGKAALEHGQQVVARAYHYLTSAGREPQPVAPNVLVPLVQAAALQDGPALAELWAALLANAADPAKRVDVVPGFVGKCCANSRQPTGRRFPKDLGKDKAHQPGLLFSRTPRT